MPFYEITTKGEEAKRLIKAESAAAAIRYCARDKFQARTISGVDDAMKLYAAGVKVEDANAEPVQGEPPKDDEPPVGDGEPPVVVEDEDNGGANPGAGTPPGKLRKATSAE